VGPLSEGIVHGKRVTCPLHNWTIDLETGSAVAPDVGCAHRHEVKMENGKSAGGDKGLAMPFVPTQQTYAALCPYAGGLRGLDGCCGNGHSLSVIANQPTWDACVQRRSACRYAGCGRAVAHPLIDGQRARG